jgi:hypothetical protein
MYLVDSSLLYHLVQDMAVEIVIDKQQCHVTLGPVMYWSFNIRQATFSPITNNRFNLG